TLTLQSQKRVANNHPFFNTDIRSVEFTKAVSHLPLVSLFLILVESAGENANRRALCHASLADCVFPCFCKTSPRCSWIVDDEESSLAASCRYFSDSTNCSSLKKAHPRLSRYDGL